MIEYLRDYSVKLKVDGDIYTFTRLARSANVAKLEAIKEARAKLDGKTVKVEASLRRGMSPTLDLLLVAASRCSV